MTIVAGTVLAVRLFYFHASEPNKHKYRLLRRLWPMGQRLEPRRILRSCNSESATCGRPRHWILRIGPMRLSFGFGFRRIDQSAWCKLSSRPAMSPMTRQGNRWCSTPVHYRPFHPISRMSMWMPISHLPLLQRRNKYPLNERSLWQSVSSERPNGESICLKKLDISQRRKVVNKQYLTPLLQDELNDRPLP